MERKVNPERVAADVLGRNPFRVGIAWSGSPRVARGLATLGFGTESLRDSRWRAARPIPMNAANQTRKPTPAERQFACSEPVDRRGCAGRSPTMRAEQAQLKSRRDDVKVAPGCGLARGYHHAAPLGLRRGESGRREVAPPVSHATVHAGPPLAVPVRLTGATHQLLVMTRRISVSSVPQTMPESTGRLPSANNREAQAWAALRGVAPPPARR